ncbi:hypothetical protein POV27_14970 [Aureisphaera galaxeae]|uniref:hypothetical protein n=1 Tax=Aureisphaera galaxeae TaxID=1538023 RepID=UPI002350CE62|nr:hypothetical protein [Aureisphaera galaxeae]MDC8005363.1 hypothetical protein [Aureisphaera galaxeae]
MKLIALIVFIALAVITGVFLLTWRKKKKTIVEKPNTVTPQVKEPSVKELPQEELPTTNEIVSGTYRLVDQVFINRIQYTAKAKIPQSHLKTIAKELEVIKQNEILISAIVKGNLTLNYTDGKSIEVGTVYNMEENQYDPIIYLEGKQYSISEEFRKSIQQLSEIH